MNRRFSKALALMMAVSLCATPVFAASVTYNPNGGTGSVTDNRTDYDSNNKATLLGGDNLTKEGYTFLGWSTNKDATTAEYTEGAQISVSDSGVTLYAVWKQDETVPEVTVTGITVKTKPTKVEYSEGEKLDLTGLVVTLTMSDKTTKEVPLAEFATNKITASPANGTELTANDKTVTLTVEGLDATATITLTVTTPQPVDKEKIDVAEEIENEGITQDNTDITTTEELDEGQKVVIASASSENQTKTTTKIEAVNSAIEELGEEATAEDIKEKLEEQFDVADALSGINIKKIKKDKTFAFSIEVQKDGEPVEHNGTVTVKIPLPKSLIDATKLLAIHYHGEPSDTNKPKLIPATISKDKIVTLTLHGLSDVVLVEYEGEDSSEDPGTDTPSTSTNDRYISYNRGGSSGGGGGGGGSSSSSNRGTSIFNQLTSTINGILKSQLSKGTVGVTTPVTGTTAASVSAPATQAAASSAVSKAVSQARATGSKNAEVSMRNISVVSASILQSIASEAQKSGLVPYLSVDTMKNGAVDVRVRIPVSAASRLGRDINMASIDNTSVKARFNRYYSNRLDVVALAHNGSFGVPASVAARTALGNVSASDLHFYVFNAASNSYQEMVQTGAFFDVNGYLHFNTELGGYIIISVGALELK